MIIGGLAALLAIAGAAVRTPPPTRSIPWAFLAWAAIGAVLGIAANRPERGGGQQR